MIATYGDRLGRVQRSLRPYRTLIAGARCSPPGRILGCAEKKKADAAPPLHAGRIVPLCLQVVDRQDLIQGTAFVATREEIRYQVRGRQKYRCYTGWPASAERGFVFARFSSAIPCVVPATPSRDQGKDEKKRDGARRCPHYHLVSSAASATSTLHELSLEAARAGP